MIRAFDLQAARAFVNEGIPPAVVRVALRKLAQRPYRDCALPSLLDSQGWLPPGLVARVRARVREEQDAARKALAVHLLRHEGLDPAALYELQLALEHAPVGSDVGSHVYDLGHRPFQLAARIDRRLHDIQSAEDALWIQQSLDENFAGVVRPRADEGRTLAARAQGDAGYWRVYAHEVLCRAHDASDLFADAFDSLSFGLSPGSRLGPYAIRAPLGEGGMGTVYLALDPDGHYVAVKTLRPDLQDDEDRARFEREARVLGRIRHPGVTALLDRGVSAHGDLYFVVPALRGTTLEDALSSQHGISLEAAFAIGDALLDALGAVHAAGVIHKDLKPLNIMLSPPSASSAVTIIDFGLAEFQGAPEPDEPPDFKTASEELLGTPFYMSPEQVQGWPLTPSSDLYSAGVLLFRAFTGHLPLRAPSSFGMLRACVETPPTTLRAASPGVVWDPHLERLFALLLSKDPAERPRSAAAVRAMLNAARARMLDVPVWTPRPAYAAVGA